MSYELWVMSYELGIAGEYSAIPSCSCGLILLSKIDDQITTWVD